ncbi:ephrin type-a receptor 4 [Plakobranchus ocellatus]|uniref:Ephrin type-a receptor 4 n=1 Tax=Plakobranchus ocellatus TaxID=259542 RepID=A0AAV4DDU8_9GAST|nr:ephrin type-a receptor 4 [Plakobranchus ocellatus]
MKNSNVDNWLRLFYVERQGADSLRINITFTMRECSRIVDASNLVQCKETFNLLYFEADGDFANDMLPSWDPLTYTRVDTIAAEATFQDRNDVAYNHESQQIALPENGPRGVYFAIQDQGACVTIVRVVIYYVTCPNVTINYAFFEETHTAARTSNIVEKEGKCVDHAREKNRLTYVCQNDGQWYKSPRGECVCDPGYEGNTLETACKECPAGHYKWSQGEGPCYPCPKYSYSTGAAPECTCRAGFFRNPRDAKSEPCTKPPSEPTRLKILNQTPTSVTLTWDPPSDLGGRSDLSYRVVCDKCGGSVTYEPGWSKFNVSRVTLKSLDRGMTYTIKIYAENGVTDISGNSTARHASIRVVTQSTGTDSSSGPDPSIQGKVIDLKVVSMRPKRLTISWNISDSFQGKVREYEVRFYPKENEASAQTRYTQYTNYTLTEFMLETTYVFIVSSE